jgi:hypothetical protein
MYWIYLDRRTQAEDRQADLESQTFNLVPERWSQIYQDRALMEVTGPDGEPETPVTDIDALDRWYEEMVASGGKQYMRGSGDPLPSEETDRWGDWQ